MSKTMLFRVTIVVLVERNGTLIQGGPNWI